MDDFLDKPSSLLAGRFSAPCRGDAVAATHPEFKTASVAHARPTVLPTKSKKAPELPASAAVPLTNGLPLAGLPRPCLHADPLPHRRRSAKCSQAVGEKSLTNKDVVRKTS
jgi:hypothetical protein